MTRDNNLLPRSAVFCALLRTREWISLLVLTIMLTMVAEQSVAQIGAVAQEVKDATPSAEEVDELIATLEDPARREVFLSQLKTLARTAEDSKGDDGLELSEALKLDQRVGVFIKNYLAWLSDSDIRASSVGKIVALTVISVIAVVIALGNAWLSRLFNRKLAGVRSRLSLDSKRFSSLFRWQRQAGYVVIALAWLYAIVVVVFDQAYQSSVSQALIAVVQTAVGVLFAVLLFLLIWEWINALIETLAEHKDSLSNRRAKTVLPVVRNVLTFVLVLLSSLVILSELGIDVMPLLAGAGVVGIAVGFGAQTLVKDFLTGFTIIIEDLLQTGDVVTVAGRTGAVSRISMRKLELRSLEGTVHTVPFSSIDILDNLTKDYSYYMLDVGVAYRENIDEVIECLKSIDEELRASEEFGGSILEPLQVLGVDQFADSAVVIKARTKTRGREKWRVGREFNRRIKLAFDKRDIEIPFPHQTIYFGVDKDGSAPPLPPARSANEAQDS
jgi:small conductance mechanosensitive channel